MSILTLNQNRLSVNTSGTVEDMVWLYLQSILNIQVIEPLCYQGVCLASEFLTYAATKMYLAFDIDFSTNTGATGVNSAVAFYNYLNALEFYFITNNPTFQAALAYNSPNANYKFLTFSRMGNATFLNMKFNGYRLTVAPL